MAEIDLRGVPCPLSWARAKVALEALDPAEELVLWLDDPRGVRDLPRAAEAEGYDVIELSERSSAWRIVLAR